MAPSNEIDNDAYNDLFNYDAGLDEILRETVETNTNDNPADATKRKTGAGDLGLDEEVKVTRKRAPIAKLDENRLLSQNGIPKLRRTAKTKLRFKGKGHEVRHDTQAL
jgi:replication fork protection complex subunit Csm3/Swi3